ncbi:MAG: PilZ domain-containing protein, partial [Gammaproteobacteria bacterium]
MDHRLNMRIPLELPVELWTADGVISGTTVDISFEGMRVHLDADPSLPAGTVQVCFEPNAVGVTLTAVAVRQAGLDLGLMFGRYDEPAEAYLEDRISEALDRSGTRRA